MSAALQADDIHEAAKTGDIKKAEAILSADKSQLDALDNLRMTPLDWAGTIGNWEMFRFLIERGASVNNVGFDGGTTMFRVAHYDVADMVTLLIEKGADIHVKNQWGRTPLHVAARRGCKDVAVLLLSKGADPNAKLYE